MTHGRPALALALCAQFLLAPLAATAAATDNPDVQRAAIAAERAEANAAYEARAAECRQRFVVTSCVNEARRTQRDTLDRLRRQQLLIDEAQRRQRAAQRVDAIRQKVAADDAARRAVPVAPPASSLRLRQPAASAAAPAAPRASAGRAVSTEQARAARAREQRERQAKTKAEMQAHREAVERRNAQRAASGKKPAAPLPTPR